MGTDSIPGSSTSHLTSACGLGKQLRMAQSLGTLHPMGDLEEIPGSWLQTGAELAFASIGE